MYFVDGYYSDTAEGGHHSLDAPVVRVCLRLLVCRPQMPFLSVAIIRMQGKSLSRMLLNMARHVGMWSDFWQVPAPQAACDTPMASGDCVPQATGRFSLAAQNPRGP